MPTQTGPASAQDRPKDVSDYILDTNDIEYETTLLSWHNGERIDADDFDSYLEDEISSGEVWSVGGALNPGRQTFDATAKTVGGIFGLPYQFSTIVDVPIEDYPQDMVPASGAYKFKFTEVGRKYSQKILSVMPVIFLTPGEPIFMAGYGKEAKQSIINNMVGMMEGLTGDNDDYGGDIDDGRFYSFSSNFPLYKKYANTALRALALYMGISDVTIPIPGKDGFVKLSAIDVEQFLETPFVKQFGNCSVPFYLDAETSISEDYGNGTTESMLAQTSNQFSATARELQFIMGSGNKGLVNNIGNAMTEAASGLSSAFGDLSSAIAGKSMLSRISSELATVVVGGKIVFPEIWADSSYTSSYNITMKLRSPDPDPVSIFLNIYMPIILLISMAAPRQIGKSSSSYESPFLVRATYKSIFSCDLGMITSLSIVRGGDDQWNAMGQPVSAEVTITIQDLYKSMFISKRLGLLTNTAQMDYLSTLAGIDLNEFEPTRMVKLAGMLIGNTIRDYGTDFWGGIKRSVMQKAASAVSSIIDIRHLT